MKEICLDILCGLSIILIAILACASIIGLVYLIITYTGEVIFILAGLFVVWLLYVIGHDVRNT